MCLEIILISLNSCVITGENFGRTLRRTEIAEIPLGATCPKVGNKQVKSTRGTRDGISLEAPKIGGPI